MPKTLASTLDSRLKIRCLGVYLYVIALPGIGVMLPNSAAIVTYNQVVQETVTEILDEMGSKAD